MLIDLNTHPAQAFALTPSSTQKDVLFREGFALCRQRDACQQASALHVQVLVAGPMHYDIDWNHLAGNLCAATG